MTDSALTFALDNLRGEDKTPLLCQYPGQTSPQPAYVELSEDGEVSADYSGDTGGTPAHVWHGRTQTWRVSAYAHPVVLARLLETGAARALLERVHAGHTVEWDGSNHRGRLTEDAQAASDKLERLLEDTFAGGDPDSCVQVWRADDYLFSSNSVLDLWDGSKPLDAVVEELEAAAESDGIVIQGDIRESLVAAALGLFDADGDDKLKPAHLAELLADGQITADQIVGREDADEGELVAVADLVSEADGDVSGLVAAIMDAEKPRTWLLTEDGEGYGQLTGTAAEARAHAAANVKPSNYPDRDGATVWVDWTVRCELTGEEHRGTVALDPDAPACADGQDHDWAQPRELVGEGVQGHGGGVVLRHVCRHCGSYRSTDTWAQRRDTGEQGLQSVSYEDADDESRAWVRAEIVEAVTTAMEADAEVISYAGPDRGADRVEEIELAEGVDLQAWAGRMERAHRVSASIVGDRITLVASL